MHKKEWYRPMGKMLSSLKIGILGCGKIGSAVVANQDGQVAGIFTTTDALRLLASRLEDELSSDLFISDEEEAKEFELFNGRNY